MKDRTITESAHTNRAKRCNIKKLSVSALRLALVLTGILTLPTIAQSQHYESFYLYVSDHPDEKEPGWSEDVQGITHDTTYWYITQSDKNDSDPAERSLWKIPVEHDLAAEAKPGMNGVERTILDYVPQLGGIGYDHFGDLDYYEDGGQGYLIIPIEDGDGGTNLDPVIALFRSSDLGYVGHAILSWGDIHADWWGQRNLGWCAVDAEGYVYTSSWQVDRCYKFKLFPLQWASIPNKLLWLELAGEFAFLDEYGDPLTLTHVQGGVFSTNGDLLYMSSGMYNTDVSPTPTDGITVFDTTTHRRVAHSTNGYGHFNFEWNPTCGFLNWHCEEPEGLTIWDLGNVGELHVLLLDNDDDTDDVSLKHYTRTIQVDGVNGVDENWGRYFDPKETITSAYLLAWDGARIAIKAGSYPESIAFSKRIQMIPIEGTVNIGVKGLISLSPPAVINIYGDGVLKLH